MVSPLHVAIGVLCGSTGGPATYGRRLVEHLAALDELRLTVLTDRPDAFGAAGVDCVAVPMHGGVDRLRWQHGRLPRALRRLRPDLYHDTKNALPWRCPVPAAVTVHDLAYYRCPETFGVLSRTFLRASTRSAVRRARRIIVPSFATAADIADVYGAHADRCVVVHHGIDPHQPSDAAARDAVRARYDLPGRWILHAGTLQARKNVDLLVRAVRQLRAAGAEHRLLLVGRRGWLAERALAEIERDDTARWLGEVPVADLRVLYDIAEVFAAPSGYEGFGFTVADALAAGLPAVISSLSSLPELCGEAAVRIGELTPDGIAAALGPLLDDEAARDRLAEAGRRRAAEFCWSDAARKHAEVYRACVE